MEESGRGDENIPAYQAERLGRYEGNSLIAELMPIPKPKVHRWDYEQLIPQFASREEYYALIKPRRIEYLRRVIEEYNPMAIICYGKGFWGDYRELFERSEFIQDGQFQTSVYQDTLVILTGHFTARTMNGRFDEVVAIIRNR